MKKGPDSLVGVRAWLTPLATKYKTISKDKKGREKTTNKKVKKKLRSLPNIRKAP
jgi:hypothetical protein